MKLKIGKDKTKKQPLPMIGGDGKSNKVSSSTDKAEQSNNSANKEAPSKAKKGKRPKRLFILLGLLVIVGLAAGYFYYDKEVAKKDTVEVNIEEVEDVSFLSEEEVAALASKDVDPSNTEQALKKAEALSLDGQKDKAAALYEDIASAGGGNYDVTVKRALDVLATGDYQGSIALLETALEELNNSSESADVKESQGDYIRDKITEIKLEEQNR